MTLDLSEPITWITIGLLVALPGLQVWLISRNQSLTPRRKIIRLTLNLALWLVLGAFVLKPTWNTNVSTKQALIAADEVPEAYVSHIKDSLKLQESFRANDFKGDYETITLVGQDFPNELLSKLSQSALHWIPYYEPDQLQAIHWKGVVRKGEMQRVTGQIQSSKNQTLKIRYASQTMDSVTLPKGRQSFSLQFPAFAQGRTQTELWLDDEPIDTIRFFTQPVESLAYQFVLDNPDFESKTLADWLGQHGNTVQLTSAVAKGLSNNVSINRTATSKTIPDIIVTDPANATDPVVKKAAAQGKSVLFINLTTPEADVKTINQALGTNWQVRKISNEEQLPVGEGLNALPFQFVDAANQVAIAGWPVAVQRNAGKVGVSLMSETFPLKLSGDSVTYSSRWASVLAQLQPSYTNNVLVDAPVYRNLQRNVQLNNWLSKPKTVRLGTDTLSLAYSAINPQTAEVTYRFPTPGWQPIQDSMAVYVDDASPSANAQLIRDFVLARSAGLSAMAGSDVKTVPVSVPTWVWLVLFLLCFSALWAEPKLG